MFDDDSAAACDPDVSGPCFHQRLLHVFRICLRQKKKKTRTVYRWFQFVSYQQEGLKFSAINVWNPASTWFYLSLFGPVLQLLLVLPLCGREVILQHIFQVLKRGSVRRFLPPAFVHDAIKLIRAVLWFRHPITRLQALDYLWVGHTWTTEIKIKDKLKTSKRIKKKRVFLGEMHIALQLPCPSFELTSYDEKG